MRTVVLLGATGLVGRELLNLLLDDESISRVIVPTRRPTGRRAANLEEVIVPFDRLTERSDLFEADQIFCALGTTIKTAGSQEAFRRVDYDYPMIAARLGKKMGVRHYLLVSAIGANAKSRVFYSRVKGELEEALIALAYPSLTIARPAFILGNRDEYRRGEEWAKRFDWLFPPKYKGIQAKTIAKALAESARHAADGVQILESQEMRKRFGQPAAAPAR